jgi:hypothetical protein
MFSRESFYGERAREYEDKEYVGKLRKMGELRSRSHLERT